jgi:hypothetical protein
VLSGQGTKKQEVKNGQRVDNYLGEALGELYVKVFLRRGQKKNVDFG